MRIIDRHEKFILSDYFISVSFRFSGLFLVNFLLLVWHKCLLFVYWASPSRKTINSLWISTKTIVSITNVFLSLSLFYLFVETYPVRCDINIHSYCLLFLHNGNIIDDQQPLGHFFLHFTNDRICSIELLFHCIENLKLEHQHIYENLFHPSRERFKLGNFKIS